MKERSFFFPLACIAAGLIWLLISMGRMPIENLWALSRLWPLLLIGAGLGLILHALWPPLRTVTDLVVVAAAVLAIYSAPSLGWNTPQWGLNFQFDGRLPASGRIVTQSRDVSNFLAVDISYPADVVIQQGPTESLTIEADDNVLPQLRSRLDAGTLYIEEGEPNWGQRINPSRPVKITITVRDLHSLGFSGAGTVRIVNLQTDDLVTNVSGAGNITFENLHVRSLDCRLSGAGSVTADGTADTLKLKISGLENFSGVHLMNQSAEVHLSGAGSATVHPRDQLTAEISGAGSVNYFGDPTVTKSINGLGTVLRVGD